MDDVKGEPSAPEERDVTSARPPSKEPAGIWTRAAARWAAVSFILTVVFVIYTSHPYWQGGLFAPWRPLFRVVFLGWLCLGLPYMFFALRKFTGRRLFMTDIGLHLLLIGQGIIAVLNPSQLRGDRRTWWSTIAAAAVVVTAYLVLHPWTYYPHERGVAAAIFVAPVFLAAIGVLLYAGTRKKSRHIWKNRRITNTMRSIGVKFFFTPLMVSFLSGHLNSVSNAWLRRKGLEPFQFPADTSVAKWWDAVWHRLPLLLPNGGDVTSLFSPRTWTAHDVRWGLDLLYDLVFITDCGVATLGYLGESRFLGNKTRSVEPTGFGWLVAVTCYPPFNNVLGTYLPLPNGPEIIKSETWLLVIKAGIVVLFAIYASATVAFGLKFSNLTNRGIITRGPYRFIRHPAYVCKCIAWWLEHLPTLSPATALFMCGLCGWYALRAYTEERHLSQDPDYVAYKKKVPWKAIPGVF